MEKVKPSVIEGLHWKEKMGRSKIGEYYNTK